jgi:hypothetical protein
MIAHNSYKNELSDILKRPTLFPIAETFDIQAEYFASFCVNRNNFLRNNFKPFEISRLAVLPEYWGSEARIMVGLHDLIILDSWKSNPKKNIYIIATHPNTRRVYERLGFEIIPGTKEQLYKNINQPAVAMVMNLQNYLNTPNPYSERCKSLFKSYLERGSFVKIKLLKDNMYREEFHTQSFSV